MSEGFNQHLEEFLSGILPIGLCRAMAPDGARPVGIILRPGNDMDMQLADDIAEGADIDLLRAGHFLQCSGDRIALEGEERLVERLRDALRVERVRQPTKPTKGSKRRRLEAKKQHGEKKRQRRKPTRNDW